MTHPHRFAARAMAVSLILLSLAWIGAARMKHDADLATIDIGTSRRLMIRVLGPPTLIAPTLPDQRGGDTHALIWHLDAAVPPCVDAHLYLIALFNARDRVTTLVCMGESQLTPDGQDTSMRPRPALHERR